MKIKELQALSEQELREKRKQLEEQLFKLNQQRYTGMVEKPHLFKATRKSIARIETMLRLKKVK
ncbi:MAG: 50S ribosomal protein L29 [Candidatus Omnitrophica bacterium]|nr:50S ribosomal protein L29 [Candidatus Omnitrophota bacterium]